MRTVTFQSVYEGVLRRHGLDPLADTVNQDTARAIADKIQKRARRALRSWAFLEWSATEERAFRTVWNSTRQFYRTNPATGKPDELFYIPNTTYYKVLVDAPVDPPVGTLPTNVAYFEELTPVDTYIELDQACRHSIGQMLGVFPINPRLNGCGQRGLKFRPSEKGIDVCTPAGPTVFINYMLPEPRYTKRPYIAMRTYGRGEWVFQPTDGNVYRCINTTTNNAPPNAAYWAVEPVLEILAHYLEAGAYADCLRTTLLGGDAQERALLRREAEEEAAEALESEIDALQAQGQTNYYSIFKHRCGSWWISQPWTGGSVTELTDECQADWIYQAPPTEALGPGLYYFATVKSLKTTTPTLVASVATTIYPLGTIAKIYTGQEFRLDTGPSSPSSDPGQGDPADYNLVSNNKHWVEVI